MSASTYNAFVLVLFGVALVALAVSAYYFVAAVIGWRSPYRKRALTRFALFALAAPLLVAAQQGLLYWVFLPSFGREQLRAIGERVAAASIAKVGERAPPFRIKDIDGMEFATDDLRGKVIALNFFATWCGACMKELPHLEKLWDQYRDRKDFALVVIGREETNDSLAAFKQKRGFSFPMAADRARSVYSLYAKEFIPRTYLISRDGTIVFESTGFTQEELATLKDKVAEQLHQ